MKKILTQERLKELLHYDPETGVFSWILKRPAYGGNKKRGHEYVLINDVDGRDYRAARLAHLYMTGEWPKHKMDHINRIKDDNRWENLRDVTLEPKVIEA